MISAPRFFRLEYRVGQNGAKHFSGVRWNTNQFEWNPLDLATYKVDITKQYKCTLSDREFNVDCWMYSPHICGSQKLLDLLNSVGARYRAVPFELFGNGRKPSKINGPRYIILLLDNISLMEASQSKFELMINLESGEPAPALPSTSHPVYAKIQKFVFRRDISPPPLYSCTETGWIMVNETFAIASADTGLIGPTFVELNDGVQYDAFEGL